MCICLVGCGFFGVFVLSSIPLFFCFVSGGDLCVGFLAGLGLFLFFTPVISVREWCLQIVLFLFNF